MSFDKRSPFAISTAWQNAPTGASSFSQDWLTVGTSGNWLTASGPSNLNIFTRLTLIGSQSGLSRFNATTFGSLNANWYKGGHLYHVNDNDTNSSSDVAIDSRNDGGPFQVYIFMYQTSHNVSTNSRYIMYATEPLS